MALADWQLVLVGAGAGLVSSLATQAIQVRRETKAEARAIERAKSDGDAQAIRDYLGEVSRFLWSMDETWGATGWGKDVDWVRIDDAMNDYYRAQNTVALLVADGRTVELVDKQDSALKTLWVLVRRRTTTEEMFLEHWKGVNELTNDIINRGRERLGLVAVEVGDWEPPPEPEREGPQPAAG